MTINEQFDKLEAHLAAKFFRLKHGTAIRFGILRVKMERIEVETYPIEQDLDRARWGQIADSRQAWRFSSYSSEAEKRLNRL